MPRPRDPGKQRKRRSAVHDGLVGTRELVGTPYLADPALRAEYARDIAPRTEAALARVLGEVYGARGVASPGRAIDLGAGTGAVGRVLRARFGESFEVVSEPTDLVAVRTALQSAGIDYESADASFVPSMTVELDAESAPKVFRLIDALEDSDDVQNVWANYDVSDEVMESVG